jgi:hypothetical protein
VPAEDVTLTSPERTHVPSVLAARPPPPRRPPPPAYTWPHRPDPANRGIVQHILALSRSAVTIRHWFEIDLDDASTEHGARVEIRELPRLTRDVRDTVRLMIATLRAPERLDRERVAPWLGALPEQGRRQGSEFRGGHDGDQRELGLEHFSHQ